MTRSGAQSVETAGSGGRTAYLLSPPAILLTPLVIFLRHHGYSLAAPEALISMALLAGLGIMLGIPGWLGGRIPAILILACILTLVLDIQLQWFSAWNFRVLGVGLAFALALWLLGKHLSTLLPTMAWALLLSSLVLPGNPRLQEWSRDPAEGPSSQGSAPSAERPLMLHIILDEQIGIEGIPKRFDPQNGLAETLRTFYVRRGFQVFGRAYSRYYDSHDSIANLLNFSHQLDSSAYYPGGFAAGKSMQRNDYFDELARRGYRTHVYQSDYMDFCNIQPEGAEDRLAAADSCYEYALENISAIEHAPLAVPEKAKLIMGMFSRLAFLTGEVQEGYSLLVRGAAALGMKLPAWKPHMGRVSSVSAMPVFGRLQQDLVESGQGSFYFAHLLLPHHPYAYDQHCVLRPNIKHWLKANVNLPNGRRNTARSRAVRYPLYLEQVICTHRKLNELFEEMVRHGVYEDAIIIIQGDHGSRIDTGPPRPDVPNLSERDFIDGFSTLYAIKLPGLNPGYDRRTLPIDELFTRHIRDGDLPTGADWVPPPLVYLARPDTPRHRQRLEPEELVMVKHRLPTFADGEIGPGAQLPNRSHRVPE